MAAVIEIKFNHFPTIARDVREKLSQHIRRTALNMETETKSRTPVRTGLLRSSWTTEMVSELTAIMGTNVNYAVFVEYGTRKMAARPMLTPAVEAVRADFETGITDILNSNGR